MKKVGVLLLISGIVFTGARFVFRIIAHYEYKHITSYWDLSEKASTIDLKSEYMNTFVNRVADAKLNGLNARLFIFTPDCDFDNNFRALTSLQQRLNEIKTMDVSSFEYQSAMQQITAQEQGEANSMLNVIEDCWYKKKHYTMYNNWIVASFILIQIILVATGVLCIAE